MPYHSKMEKNSPSGIKKNLDKKTMDKLKDHSKLHKGGMRSLHMKEMVKNMKLGDTFSTAHTKATKEEKKKPKMATAKLGGETIKFRRGGLHRSLKVPMEYSFKRAELEKLNKIETGKDFSFQGKKIKMTPLVKKQLTLGINLMKRT